jgi:hypothetical protein
MADPVAWAAEAPAVADAPEAEPEGVAPFDDVEDEATEAEGEPAVEAPSLCEIAPIAETPSLFEAAPVEEETAPVDVEPTPEAPSLCESATTTDAPSMYEAASVAEGPSLFDASSMYETAPIGEAPSLFDAPSLYEAAPVAEGPSLFDAPAKPAEPPRAERPAEEAASREVAPAGVPGEGDERVRSWARDEADRLDRQEREGRREPRPAGPAPGAALRIDRAHRDDDEAEGERFDPTRSPRSREGRRPAEPALPSVQDVLAASQWARRAPTPSPAPHKPTPRPKPKAAPSPTTAVAPSQWSLPSWLTWPPATFLTLTVGASFTLCSWWWAVDSRNAAIAGQAALALRQGTAKDRPLPKGVAPPPTSWWRTTPLHLAQWSAYLSATRTEQGWTETPADLIADAAAISPVNAVARLSKARMDRTGPGAGAEADDPREDLGLSRDAVSLAWTAQRLHKAGKDEAAVRTYRRALEIAERSGFEHEEPLVFSDDPAAPRYLLPGEKLAGSIIAELIADSSWTYREWSAAIPRGAVAALVAAKGLKEQGRIEADQALADLASALRLDDGREGDDRPASARAVDHAVAAEALAMKASWKDAQQQYKAAIGLMVDAKVKRSWWFNLADVAARLNDEDQRRRALDEVLAAVDGDEVSRRALDVQRAGRP